METTRHFVATAYVVCDGATALHHHDRLDLWLPPGGHIDRGELPRSAARREVREEVGHEPTLLESETSVSTPVVTELPGPEYLLLEDIHYYEGGDVGHQHVDFVYFGSVPSREIAPSDGERAAEHWEWYTPDDLRAADELGAEVVELGLEAIERVTAAGRDSES
ncbi:NUDIX domain-containing protein [Halospeciosus flavus]|uniref:NUDIX domain-containing protein n=1 Tax=Halospeciosus flavus TaxID=3032283 RepID=A0ABD5Z2M6_9EURY|nr:NUDIX domain-containing protein [Halospeciosus flavus]